MRTVDRRAMPRRASKNILGWSLALVSALHCNAGCTSSSPQSQEGQICDGTADLRLGYRPMGGNTNSSLIHELGSPYMYIRGDCSYWTMWAPAYEWRDVRVGTLGADDEIALAEDLHYAQWRELRGSYPGGDDGLVFSDGVNTIWCGSECELSGGIGKVGDLPVSIEAWGEELFERGTPAAGPVRALVYPAGGMEPADPCAVAWPLAWSPEQIAVEFDGQGNVGDSVLIDDTADSALLRELRRWWRDDLDDPVCAVQDHMVVLHEQREYSLWVRDSIPLESDDGLIALPAP